ncbi:hypothetical protein RJT34_16007 [Clitoria ternatea]|uniref:Uncharacterized protein n=1 Tax=Clitoria ternatea TaxID=43366 RepID=A0AAN9J7X8_CLITE
MCLLVEKADWAYLHVGAVMVYFWGRQLVPNFQRDQWLASIRFTVPPMEPTQPVHSPTAQDEPMMEAEEEAKEGNKAN